MEFSDKDRVMSIQLTIKQPTDIPPITNEWLQISDRYFAKIRTVGGDESKAVVVYDHKNKRWSSIHPGMKELIEYYV